MPNKLRGIPGIPVVNYTIESVDARTTTDAVRNIPVVIKGGERMVVGPGICGGMQTVVHDSVCRKAEPGVLYPEIREENRARRCTSHQCPQQGISNTGLRRAGGGILRGIRRQFSR
jgi:hypothetical protein